MAVIDVVKWDAAPGVFAWKFPSCELSTKTQLIVSESQEAFLFKEGQIIGPIGSGRHTLNTANFPVLTTLLKKITGNSPFTAEVWFIQKAFKLDVRWGTSSPIQVEDPKYHIMLPLRAFGQYGMVVEDSSKFLLKLVGTLPAFVTKTLTEYFRGIVLTKSKDLIAKYVVRNGISVLQIGMYLDEISNTLEANIAEVLKDYGIRPVNFTVNSITTDDNDPAVRKLKDALATKVEMDIVGFNYQQKRSFDTLESAAGNPGAGGGVMAAGLGMGMGVGMGMPMGNAMGSLAQNINVASTIPCPKWNAQVAADAAFCPKCGNSLGGKPAASMIVCDKCGTQSPAGTRFCPNCGDVFYCCPECGADNPEDAVVCRACGKPMPVKCPQCGKLLPGGAKFCNECGAHLKKCCSECGAEVDPQSKFCPNCGSKQN